MDYEDDENPGEWRGWDLQVLLLHSDTYHDAMGENTSTLTFGLVLRSEGGGQAAKIRRIGTAAMNSREGDNIREDENNWKTLLII